VRIMENINMFKTSKSDWSYAESRNRINTVCVSHVSKVSCLCFCNCYLLIINSRNVGLSKSYVHSVTSFTLEHLWICLVFCSITRPRYGVVKLSGLHG